MNFAGNPRAFFRHGGTCFLDVESIQGLIFIEGLFDLGGGSNPRFNQFPHEFGAGAAEDRDAHAVKVLQRLPDVRAAGDVDDEVNALQVEQYAVILCDGNLQPLGEGEARRRIIDFRYRDDIDQWVVRENFHQGFSAATGSNNGHVGDPRGAA